MRIGSSRAIGFVIVLALLLTTIPASAQYFGRNKVRYENFEFQVLATEHFDIYFYPEERPGVDISARLAERWYTRLSRVFSHQMLGRQPLILYGSHPDFEQTNVISGELGEATGGVTESLRRRIVLPLGRPLADIDHVIGHELVHAFQFDIAAAAAPDERSGLFGLPLWFVEGMAEYLSIGPTDTNTAMWLRDAVQRNMLPTIAQLDDPTYFPYRWGHAFWAYVAGRWGDRVIGRLLLSASTSGDVEAAIAHVLDIESAELTRGWHEEIVRLYAPVLASTTPPDALGRRIISTDGFASDVNVGPALSPNGRWLAFFSSRSIFSMDLYLAETENGRIARRLTSRSVNPHFSSVQFIHSAGAWDRSERRLAIATVAAGRAALAIYDGIPDAKHRELSFAEVDEIFNPTWAPTGDAIAFTGSNGGLTDLYVYDLSTSALRRMTNDPFAELQPAWSPDGRRIAFVTDRFSTDLSALSVGDYRLAIFDVERGTVEQLPGFSQGDSFNPQWSPDGTVLYFLADRTGIPNLFRLTLSSGEIVQLTNVATGISGITASSPAMSISARSGVMTFSVYERGQYHIHSAVPAELTPLEPAELAAHANALPPLKRSPGYVTAFLLDASMGLPKPMNYPTTGYTASLSLESVGEPGVAVGANRFGTQVGGDISMFFRDVLGTHSLGFAVQSGSLNITNTPAVFGYLNEARRWSFGVAAAQTPFVTGTFQTTTSTTPAGESVVVEQTTMYRETQRTASAIVAYPFSRARRVEFSAGLTQTSFDQTAYTVTYRENDGNVIAAQLDESMGVPSLTLAATSVSLVGDAANFGATGPVQGWRYRVETAPTLGSLDFASVLADFRGYVMPVPFYTVAVRALHYGRYGSGSEDPRLYSLYLGYPMLVRGYHGASFETPGCGPDPLSSPCPAAEHLFGSRMLVGNLEFRFPILRPFGLSSGMYGPLPAEVALFADTGVAWNADEAPSWVGGPRSSVSSVGVTLRVSLGAGLIGQFDAVRPLDRHDRGWVYQFNLSPGF
jgi:Tol biopolymer transport system component